MATRSFTKKPKPKSDDYHGSCQIASLPEKYTAADSVIPKSLNLAITFEEALKLSVAIQGCLQSLNRYNRSTKAGKEMGLALSIKFDEKQITVIEAASIRAE
jgi:hypothetical protein